MNLDPVLLSRIQFAMTIGFHIIFPSISVGLAWLLVGIEGMAWRKKDATYERMGKFFGKFLVITFALGVATGITMEFQFGTNWGQYAKFVGDIFGAPLAAEAIFAFFLESTFLGIYLFGRDRLPKGLHWFSVLMVAVGATLSIFWILVANSWQQTPAGYAFNPATGRAELTSFMAAVFNPSMIVRFFHVQIAVLICGAFFMAGVAAYLLLKNAADPVARKALKLAIIVGLITSVLELFPFGHEHARQVGAHQPEKLAAMEGLFETGPNAPLTVFGIPTEEGLIGAIRIPGMLSVLTKFKPSAVVRGLNDFPKEDRPPVVLPFMGFHVMVGLGMLFIAMTAWGAIRLRGGRLYSDRWFLWSLILASPLPLVATEGGWIAAEVGRQPWIVYRLLRTQDAASVNVSGGEVLFSLVLFGALYALLFALFLYLVARTVQQGPEAGPPKETPA